MGLADQSFSVPRISKTTISLGRSSEATVNEDNKKTPSLRRYSGGSNLQHILSSTKTDGFDVQQDMAGSPEVMQPPERANRFAWDVKSSSCRHDHA